MLHLFRLATESETLNTISERISRVLLERVITCKPHPSGLVVAFVELVNNEDYGFGEQPFVCAEESIYGLFVKARENFSDPRTASRAE